MLGGHGLFHFFGHGAEVVVGFVGVVGEEVVEDHGEARAVHAGEAVSVGVVACVGEARAVGFEDGVDGLVEEGCVVGGEGFAELVDGASVELGDADACGVGVGGDFGELLGVGLELLLAGHQEVGILAEFGVLPEALLRLLVVDGLLGEVVGEAFALVEEWFEVAEVFGEDGAGAFADVGWEVERFDEGGGVDGFDEECGAWCEEGVAFAVEFDEFPVVLLLGCEEELEFGVEGVGELLGSLALVFAGEAFLFLCALPAVVESVESAGVGGGLHEFDVDECFVVGEFVGHGAGDFALFVAEAEEVGEAFEVVTGDWGAHAHAPWVWCSGVGV